MAIDYAGIPQPDKEYTSPMDGFAPIDQSQLDEFMGAFNKSNEQVNPKENPNGSVLNQITRLPQPVRSMRDMMRGLDAKQGSINIQPQVQPFSNLPQIQPQFGPPIGTPRQSEIAGQFAEQQLRGVGMGTPSAPTPDIFGTKPLDQQAQGILQEMSGVQGQMGQPQGAVQFPGGGVGSDVGLPEVSLTPSGGLTPTEQARQDAIGQKIARGEGQTGLAPESMVDMKPALNRIDQEQVARLGGGPEAERMVREARQEETIKRSGQTAASQKIARSLREQGMTKEQILAELGGADAYSKMSQNQRFKKLNNLNKSRQTERMQSKNEQRRMERTRNKARYNEDGTPKNDAAVFIEHKRFADDTGADPESDTTNYDRMTASQKREYDRYQKLVTSGARVPNRMQKRQDKIQEEVQAKGEKEFEKKTAQQKEESRKSLIASRIASAQNAEEAKYYSEREKKIKAIDARKKGSKLSSKEKVELNKKKDKLNEEILAGYTAPEVDITPTVTTQEQFDALPSGAQYKNNSGQIATKP